MIEKSVLSCVGFASIFLSSLAVCSQTKLLAPEQKNYAASLPNPRFFNSSRYRFFTLLEILVGLTLVLMAAGAIGWKTHAVIERHRFRADLERLKSSLLTTHKMAVNMQADWEGTLKLDGNSWIFEAVCVDSVARKPTPLKLHVTDVLFDGEKQDQFTLTFYSSGKILPSGTLQFRGSKDTKGENWDLPEIFDKKEGSGEKSLGPIHPNEA